MLNKWSIRTNKIPINSKYDKKGCNCSTTQGNLTMQHKFEFCQKNITVSQSVSQSISQSVTEK